MRWVQRAESGKVISGGPMMGFALSSLDVAVTKGTSGILVIPEEDVSHGDDIWPLHTVQQMY